DHELEDILAASAEAGARWAGYVLLRLPYEIKDLFREWLAEHFPERAAHVMSVLREMRGGRDNDPRFGSRMRGTGVYAQLLRNRFQLACKRLNLNASGRDVPNTKLFRPPTPPGAQMTLGLYLSVPREQHVRRARRRRVPGAAVAQLQEVDAAEQRLAGPEDDRRDRDVHLVDQPRLQVLADGADAAADADVLAACGLTRLAQRRLDAIGHEVKRRAALHGERPARVVREYEHRRVVGRVVAPPAAPGFVGPRATHGPEHVAPEDPGADVCEAACREVIVDAGLAALGAQHALRRGAGGEYPLEHREATHAQRVLEALVRSGPIAVDRQPEGLYAQFGHLSAP